MAYFRIKDAASKVGVLPHVLRFWENQFPNLKPNKTGKGQRLYSDEDIEKFIQVKHLLYTEGYSIQGAKKALKEQKSSPISQKAVNKELAHSVLNALEEIKEVVATI